MCFLKRIISVVPVILLGVTNYALATTSEYTSLISASMFDGVKADVNTAAAGIIAILIIILGVSLLVRVLR